MIISVLLGVLQRSVHQVIRHLDHLQRPAFARFTRYLQVEPSLPVRKLSRHFVFHCLCRVGHSLLLPLQVMVCKHPTDFGRVLLVLVGKLSF